MASRLKETYKNEIVDGMVKKFGYKNIMEVPKLDKIVINMGVGEAKDNAKVLETAVRDLETISGQKAVLTRAKKSVANFKIREGMPIGCKVTLRGDKMYEFADRLINLALPRVRDFRGVNPNAFDGRGNYALGIKEQLIFPEIEFDKVDKVRGMDIIFVTTAKTDDEAREFLAHIVMPFKKKIGRKFMAKTSMKVKQQRPAKFSTREYSRCRICGRPHAYLRKYGICRICFRELAYKGQIPGVKKASW